MSSCSAASRREAPPSTRAITRMRMSAEYAFGIVRPPDESMPPNSPYRSLGNLRFYSARTCSRYAGKYRLDDQDMQDDYDQAERNEYGELSERIFFFCSRRSLPNILSNSLAQIKSFWNFRLFRKLNN